MDEEGIVSPGEVAEINEDGIICSILSSMRMIDAVRTSILSRRWRNIWAYIPNLNFDAFNMLEVDPISPSYSDSFSSLSSVEQKAVLRIRRKKFITSVTEFLLHHQGYGVKLFSVLFQLNKKHAYHLDKWVDFAIKSGAKELELVLNEPMIEYSSTTEPYDFSFHLFDYGRGSSIECLSLYFCNLNPHPTFTGFSSLKTLHLGCVYMTDMQMDILLSHCFVIENLSIDRCQGLINLDISHQSCRLKMLFVYECPALMKIEIDSACLTLFEYEGDWMRLCVKHASQVAKAKIVVEDIEFSLESYVTRLDSDLPHLEALSLFYRGPAEVGMISNSYKFTHLKMLDLYIWRSKKIGILGLVFFLRSAPLLEKFRVKIGGDREQLQVFEGLCLPDSTHSNLRQFELCGFCGRKDEIELVLYVIRNAAVALVLVTVDPSIRSYCPNFSYRIRLDACQKLSVAAHLSGVKLVLRDTE